MPRQKFNNETSLNYHELMTHTASEFAAGRGETLQPSASEQKKLPPKIREKRKEEFAPQKFNVSSSDSDSEDDSKHLSLAHISRSVQRMSGSKSKQEIKKASEAPAKQVKHAIKVVPKAAKTEKEKQSCDKCKKKFSDNLALEYHKITFHVEKVPPKIKPEAEIVKPDAASQKEKEQGIKRKSSLKLPEGGKKQKIEEKKVTDSNKFKCLSGIFRKQKQHESSENESSTKDVINSIKNTLLMMNSKGKSRVPLTLPGIRNEKNKGKQIGNSKESDSDDSDSTDDSSEESDVGAKKKKVLKKRKSLLIPEKKSSSLSRSSKKAMKRDFSSDEDEVEQESNRKKVPNNEFARHSISDILKRKDISKASKPKLPKDIAKAGNLNKIISKVYQKKTNTVTSDSEPEIVKKETIKTEQESDGTVSSSSLLEKPSFLSKPVVAKVKCDNCPRTFKNDITLQYHQLHCEAPKSSLVSAVEKKIIHKKAAESPADKILRKLSEKVIESQPSPSPEVVPSNKEKEINDEMSKKYEPKMKKISVNIKKINKKELNRLSDDVPSTGLTKKKNFPVKKSPFKPKSKSKSSSEDKTWLGGRLNRNNPNKETSGKRFHCDRCKKKFSDKIALEYHKITFHVEEEAALLSSSAYSEQMKTDPEVLKVTRDELNLDGKKNPEQNKKISKEKSAKSQPNLKISSQKSRAPEIIIKAKSPNRNKSSEWKVNESKVKDKDLPKKNQNNQKMSTKKTKSYCFCDKPETNDMIGCDFCDQWYHPECIGLNQEQVLELAKSKWRCPQCDEKDSIKKVQPRQRQSTNTLRRASQELPKAKEKKVEKSKPGKEKAMFKSKRIVDDSESDSDSSLDVPIPKAKAKMLKKSNSSKNKVIAKAKVVAEDSSSDSSSDSIEDVPKPKAKIIKKSESEKTKPKIQPSRAIVDSGSDSSSEMIPVPKKRKPLVDAESEESEEDIIRIPVDSSLADTYYRKK